MSIVMIELLFLKYSEIFQTHFHTFNIIKYTYLMCILRCYKTIKCPNCIIISDNITQYIFIKNSFEIT